MDKLSYEKLRFLCEDMFNQILSICSASIEMIDELSDEETEDED